MVAMLMGWILVGLFAGLLAQAVLPGPRDLVAPILIGIAGALLGGYLGGPIAGLGMDNPGYWLSSVAGAVLLLTAYRMVLTFRK